MDLDAGGIVAQVHRAGEHRRVERAGVDHLARGDDADIDLRLAAREVGEPRHQPAGGEHRRRGDFQIRLIRAQVNRFHRRGERIEALAQPRQRGARGFR